MRLQLLRGAQKDLIEGFHFYERQQPGLGDYFKTSLFSDIQSLLFYHGIHTQIEPGVFRLLSKKFSSSIYYRVNEDRIEVHAIIDARRSPEWIKKRLQQP